MQHRKQRSEYSEQAPKTVNQHSSLSVDSFDVQEFQNQAYDNAEGRPHEECGVFGIYAPGVDVARRTFFGIFALQSPRGGNLVGFCQGFAFVTGKGQVFGGIFHDSHYRLRVQRRALVAIVENLATGDNAETEFIA